MELCIEYCFYYGERATKHVAERPVPVAVTTITASCLLLLLLGPAQEGRVVSASTGGGAVVMEPPMSPPSAVQLGQQVDFDRRGMTMGANEDWHSGTSHIGGPKAYSQLEDRQNEQADTEATQNSYQGLELDRPRNSRARSKRYSPGLDEQFHMDRADEPQEAPQQADTPAHNIAGDGGHELQQRFRAPTRVDEYVRQQGAPPLGDEPAAAQVDRGDDAQDDQDVTNHGREPISEGYASLRAQMAQSQSVQTPSLGVADVAPQPDGGEPADEPTQSQAATPTVDQAPAGEPTQSRAADEHTQSQAAPATDDEAPADEPTQSQVADEPTQSQAATPTDDEAAEGEPMQRQVADESAQSQTAAAATDDAAPAGEPTQSQAADEPTQSQAALATDDEAPADEPTQSQVADEPTQSQAATPTDNEAAEGEPMQRQVADEPAQSQTAAAATDDAAPAGAPAAEPIQSQVADEPTQSQAATTTDEEAPAVEPTQSQVADAPGPSQAATTATDDEARAGEATPSQAAQEPTRSQAATTARDDEAPAGEPTQSQAAEEPAQNHAVIAADGEAPTIEPTQNHTTAAIAEGAASADVPAKGQTATAAGGGAFADRPASQTAAGPKDQVLAVEPGAQVDARGPSAAATTDEALAAQTGGEGQPQEAAEETNASTAAGAATAQNEDALQRVFEEKSAAAASLAAEEASPSTARTGQADQTATLYAAPHANHTEETGTSTVSPTTNPGIGDLHEPKVAQPNPSTAQYKRGEANESNASEQVQPDSDETGAAGRSRDLPAPSTSLKLQDAVFTSSRGAGPETRPRPSLRVTSNQQESSTAPEKTLNRSSPLATVAVQSQSDLTMRKSSLSRSETVAETSNGQGGNQRVAGTSLRSGSRQTEPELDASMRSAPAIVGDVQS
ncbi:olpB [Symbiodinium microadriaticum]|nr:olpB [Symbiodinium microadriaticum]